MRYSPGPEPLALDRPATPIEQEPIEQDRRSAGALVRSSVES
jgi:hypothetical protein